MMTADRARRSEKGGDETRAEQSRADGMGWDGMDGHDDHADNNILYWFLLLVLGFLLLGDVFKLGGCLAVLFFSTSITSSHPPLKKPLIRT